ncbi:unnamed protein product [Peniophora sp. CBMAI 1063]|nr:unnamed protein product [Peniophora sp. CBMAI 1063]
MSLTDLSEFPPSGPDEYPHDIVAALIAVLKTDNIVLVEIDRFLDFCDELSTGPDLLARALRPLTGVRTLGVARNSNLKSAIDMLHSTVDDAPIFPKLLALAVKPSREVLLKAAVKKLWRRALQASRASG